MFEYLYDDKEITLKHTVTKPDVEPPVPPAAGPHDKKKLDTLKGSAGALYNNVKQQLGTLAVTLPPSGAIAGIYARVDESRGVWKAPANVRVNAISDLTFKVTDEMQKGLNVDPTAGKSINAIRAFAGRGILVWGARDPGWEQQRVAPCARAAVLQHGRRGRPRRRADDSSSNRTTPTPGSKCAR